MKKLIAILLALVLMFALVACGETEGPDDDGEKVWKVALMLPYIGDASFFDSMNNGRLELEARDNVETTLIEMGTDQTRWESYYDDACDGDVKYDLIATGSSEVEPFLYEAAAKYPDQLFFNYDFNATQDASNVFGVTYKTSEIGYLAGLVAALVTTSGMDKTNEDAKVGVVVGMDTPYMNDFIGSFCQVCNEYNVQVYIGYPVSATPFADPAQGLELASAMYNDGVDIIWQVAGGTGTGVFQAAADAGRYSIGVDVDQVISMVGQPDLAGTIVTSMLKNCGDMFVDAVDMLIDGEYPGGELRRLGIADGAVGIAENDQYNTLVPEEIRTAISEAIQKVIDGEVEIYSVLDNPDAWEAIKAEATAAR